MRKFFTNGNKQLVQIGAWLRRNYAIYELADGTNDFNIKDVKGGSGFTLRKAALVGPQMQLYFKPIDFFSYFRRHEWEAADLIPTLEDLSVSRTFGDTNQQPVTSSLTPNGDFPSQLLSPNSPNSQESGGDGICGSMCRDTELGLNKYVLGAINLLEKYDESVTLIQTLSDDDYDQLLSQNVVFLDMVDAAAINTLLECIARNTPIVINCLPAIVDILGPQYPLFYHNLADVPDLITYQNIFNANMYLQQMDKTPFLLDSFLAAFTSSDVFESL
ncbi:hypothetical protein BDK51DRAFT_37181 [Blyttiomyces helicus]|uniref:Uncharacterized protein n=1 Tax=Blyttiomyces helicus TaxID=388810 RepID=A0A4P9WNZ7_9FUNG|nr:hypothetical protein BDK51DRAFT_37181 [Blyttiomyces helicus]|eukprot:RKO92930.1 hypothetical protein BDK51DRAFT_37181 [Blyttiomyces helicus]